MRRTLSAIPFGLANKSALFSMTRGSLACRDEDDRERANRIESEGQQVLEDNKKLEQELCVARSVMAKMWGIFGAHREGQLKIPTQLEGLIQRQLAAHQRHRKEEHRLEMKKTVVALEDVRGEMRETAEGRKRHDELSNKEKELINHLNRLKAVDTNSDAFLDRDAFTRGPQR